MVLVAALQFASTTNIEENLATCLRMIDKAGESRVRLMVLPEFCNHLSWYDSQDHAYDVALEENGHFLRAIAEKAKEHQSYIIINCSMKRPDKKITVTSVMFDDKGEQIAIVDKQTLMGHENNYFERATKISPVIDTPVGKIGIYICRDGVTMETPRSLALRGAEIFCHSLNSFATDEASLHVPSRGIENKIFVISANKVGSLIPLDVLDLVSEKLGVTKEALYGAGGSQIIAPTGEVLAKAARSGEAVVIADIDISLSHNKERADGSHIFSNRRPSLYREISQKPQLAENLPPVAEKMKVAVYQPLIQAPDDSYFQIVMDDVCEAIQNAIHENIELLVLPELFCFKTLHNLNSEKAIEQSQIAIEIIQEACADSSLHVCASLIETGNFHSGLLISSQGIVFRQHQLHYALGYEWVTLGDSVETVDMPWGRFAMLVGHDSTYPELARVIAIRGVDVIAIPFDLKEKTEITHGIVDRSAENRICIVASTRPKDFGGSLIITQWKDFTIFTDWQERTFDGTINQPLVSYAPLNQKLTIGKIHPATSRIKLMSQKTDLIQGRPWYLSDVITN